MLNATIDVKERYMKACPTASATPESSKCQSSRQHGATGIMYPTPSHQLNSILLPEKGQLAVLYACASPVMWPMWGAASCTESFSLPPSPQHPLSEGWMLHSTLKPAETAVYVIAHTQANSVARRHLSFTRHQTMLTPHHTTPTSHVVQ